MGSKAPLACSTEAIRMHFLFASQLNFGTVLKLAVLNLGLDHNYENKNA